jgi:hypothetical protein
MTWPPDALWPRIAALWGTHGTPSASANERAKAFVTLKQYQSDFGLTDCQLAYIAEYHAHDPSSRIVKRERPENAFEIVLGVIGEVGLVMPFEHFVIDTAWVLHSYICSQYLHTPRLMIHSRGSGYGKTVRLSIINELAYQSRCMVAPSPPVIYRYLEKCPLSTLVLDDAERMDWGRESLLVEVIDAGHRQGFPIPRVEKNGEIRFYPTFAPLAFGLVLDRYLREKFSRQVTQVLTRSIACEMQQSNDGVDNIFPGDPRFVLARAVIARFAETFRCPPPTSIRLPPGIFARCANNYFALAAVADALGYGATLRAAAVAIEAANFDPRVGLYEKIHELFERQQASGLWAKEIVQALREVEGGPWGSLTTGTLYDLLWPDGIEPKTVWKKTADGTRQSNNGFTDQQFEPVWRKLAIRDTETQPSKIIRLPRHKRDTEDTHE